VRRHAALSLGRVGIKKRAVEALVEVLNDPKELVRSGAAEALGELDDEEAIPHLEELLSDEDPKVVAAAEDALMKLGVELE